MTTYKNEAIETIEKIDKYFSSCITLNDYEKAYYQYIIDNKINYPFYFQHGRTRIALIASDYVIKIDYNKDTVFGTCENELENYKFVCDQGFSEYFAEITKYIYNQHNYYIMPTIEDVNNEDYEVYDYCSEELNDFLFDNFYDLHGGNYGWKNNHIVIIDYAARR